MWTQFEVFQRFPSFPRKGQRKQESGNETYLRLDETKACTGVLSCDWEGRLQTKVAMGFTCQA